jgi:hypothetical protein
MLRKKKKGQPNFKLLCERKIVHVEGQYTQLKGEHPTGKVKQSLSKKKKKKNEKRRREKSKTLKKN